MTRFLSTLLRDERGATAVEYGLIISLVVVAMIASLWQVANTSHAMWTGVSKQVEDSSSKEST